MPKLKFQIKPKIQMTKFWTLSHLAFIWILTFGTLSAALNYLVCQVYWLAF